MLPQVGDVKPLGLTKVSKTLAAQIAKQGPKASIDELDWIENRRFVTATLSVEAKSYSHHIFDLSRGTDTKISELYFTDKACPRLSAHRNRTAHRARRDATGCFVAQAQKGLKALFLWCLKCTAGLRAK